MFAACTPVSGTLTAHSPIHLVAILDSRKPRVCFLLILTTHTKVAPSGSLSFPSYKYLPSHPYARSILLGQIEHELWLPYSFRIHCPRSTLAPDHPQDSTAAAPAGPRDHPRLVLTSPSSNVQHDSEPRPSPQPLLFLMDRTTSCQCPPALRCASSKHQLFLLPPISAQTPVNSYPPPPQEVTLTTNRHHIVTPARRALRCGMLLGN